MKPVYFATPKALRKWFDKHHATSEELWVGYYKVGSGKPSITWQESVDEALCVGWIDGIRKSIDEISYTIRFTPRKKTSTWSAINIGRVKLLTGEGRMRPEGLEAYNARNENKVGLYSYEQRPPDLPAQFSTIFRRNKPAWEFYQSQPPSYRRAVTWYVVSAKKEETRISRLQKLIDECANGRRLGQVAQIGQKK
jgi:uncharacterized protein YdeI (YjbR/CyaY-like superfamily)